MSLRLRRAARGTYGDTSTYSRDPRLPVFMADLAGPWGLRYRPEVIEAGLGQTYGEMAEQLLPAVVGPDEPVDVLVLAFGVHDVRPGRSAATYLCSVCPGQPVGFAVCDQGTLAPFTALRLLESYVGDGGRGLLVVAEQAALHYAPAADVPLPERHAAVALLVESAGPGPVVTVRQHAGLSTVDRTLAAEVAALAGGRGDVTLVPGPGLAGVPLPEGAACRPPPAGQPHTGPWWRLADLDRGLAVLADADGGELALAAVDFSGQEGLPR